MEKSAVYNDLPELKITEFEHILQLYGMNKKEFCDLRGKSKAWFHNNLRKNANETGFVPFVNVKVLAEHIGRDIFEQILNKIKNRNANEHNI